MHLTTKTQHTRFMQINVRLIYKYVEKVNYRTESTMKRNMVSSSYPYKNFDFHSKTYVPPGGTLNRNSFRCRLLHTLQLYTPAIYNNFNV